MSDPGSEKIRADAVIGVRKYEPSVYEEPADGPSLTPNPRGRTLQR